MKKVFHFFIYIGFFSAPECGGGPDDGEKCVSGGRAPRRPAGRGHIQGARWRPRRALSPVSPVMPGPAWRPGGDVDAGSPPSGPALSIAAESWGPVQAAAARRSYSQIFQILFDFRQPGVGLGDQPGVPGYPPSAGPPCRGLTGVSRSGSRAVRRTQAGQVIFRSGVRKSSSSCTNPSSAGAMRSSRFLVCAAGEDRPFAAAPGAVDRLLGEAGTRAFFAPQAGFSRCLGGASGFVWWSRPGGLLLPEERFGVDGTLLEAWESFLTSGVLGKGRSWRGQPADGTGAQTSPATGGDAPSRSP